MKKFVILLALLCFLSVFQCVFAHTNPIPRENLIYDGTDQYLVEQGVADSKKQHFYYRNPWTKQWGTDLPAGHYPGKYTVEWLLVNGSIVPGPEKTGSKITIFIREFNPPQAQKGLVSDGTSQYLVRPKTGVAKEKDVYYYRNLYTGEWTQDVPEATDAGTYTVEYYLGNPQNPPKTSTKGVSFTVTIEKATSGTTPQPVIPEDPTAPQPISRKYDGLERPLVTEGDTENNKYVWWYRLSSFSNPAALPMGGSMSSSSIPSDEWSTVIPTGYLPGTYIVDCIRLLAGVDPETITVTDLTKSVTLTVVISPAENNNGNNNPPAPNPDTPISRNSFYYIGNGEDLFSGDYMLPATGFPTRFNKPLSVKPADVSYEELAMRIQIPSIDVDVELTGVPEVEKTWAVEWLGKRAGLLSGSAMPGEGFSMIAAHNHLNAEEIGPFALLFSLEENDRVFVNTPDNGLQMYSVYANELLEPGDLEKMASIAQKADDALILVTCENEMVDGGYQNRRVVFARPLF